MREHARHNLVTFREDQPVWDRVFTVNPAGAGRDQGGERRVRPRPQAHGVAHGLGELLRVRLYPAPRTYHNARREGVFTVSYPRPTQVVLASLAASPSEGDGSKAAAGRAADLPGERGGRGLHPGRVPVPGVRARPHRRRLRGEQPDRRPHRGRPRPARTTCAPRRGTTRPHPRLPATCLPEPGALRRAFERATRSLSRPTSCGRGSDTWTTGAASAADISANAGRAGERLLERLALGRVPLDASRSRRSGYSTSSPGPCGAGLPRAPRAGTRSGGHLYARPGRRERHAPVQLLLGHCDTVWPLGTLEGDAGRGRRTTWSRVPASTT